MWSCGLSHRVELMDTSREKGKMEMKMQGGGKKRHHIERGGGLGTRTNFTREAK